MFWYLALTERGTCNSCWSVFTPRCEKANSLTACRLGTSQPNGPEQEDLPWDVLSLLGSRVRSPGGLRRGLDAPFCLRLGMSLAARRPQTPASPPGCWIISLGIALPVQRFLRISWNCLCCMKSPSSQMWESSSSSPGLRALLFFLGLLHSASWLFGGGWSPCTCVGQVLLVLGLWGRAERRLGPGAGRGAAWCWHGCAGTSYCKQDLALWLHFSESSPADGKCFDSTSGTGACLSRARGPREGHPGEGAAGRYFQLMGAERAVTRALPESFPCLLVSFPVWLCCLHSLCSRCLEMRCSHPLEPKAPVLLLCRNTSVLL
ncbi:uncharacterized protein LOC118175717 [Oxyura jamaicensis]|uniref:uncharacterized protein LOC118175717 n=1 Tax=Oxyura jamaicensis TaxID=8884 RepID=UPI0015A5AF16|nr:uncharacterized protein LOC118175717 [Oxyura jamaicensis]